MTQTAERLFKCLGSGAVATHGGSGTWYKPHGKRPGKWMPPIEGDLVPCENGYHLARAGEITRWLSAEIYEAEARGERIDADDKIVVRQARLVRKLNWDERIARHFACDCAERILPIYEEQYPHDTRARVVIAVARRYADGRATDEERVAARDAAWAAAGDAAYSAADFAAYSAAYSAAHSAADSAAYYAAHSAADFAAYSAAYYAAHSAADFAARDAERAWQTQRLLAYLDGEIVP